ncbi:MAG: DUF1702 family protein [Streptosporangiaceae bacterium]
MPTSLGNIRKRLLMPDPSEVTFEKRGFHAGNPLAQSALEMTGAQFLAGLEIGLTSRGPAEVEELFEKVDRPFRGFAHEGAAMGFAIADAFAPWRRGGRIRAFADGPGAPHIYLVHVGIGWAMARLPRPLWRSVVLPDPLLRWLALDGYGFHQAYFATPRYVVGQRPITVRVPWADPSGYAARVADQGIGRALWFVCGADAEYLADLIGRFPQPRRADLWSGTGLAAAYAGGADPAELGTLRKLAAGYRQELAQGAAFAAKARLRAGLVTPHTVAAVGVLCELSVEDAAHRTDEALAQLPPDGPVPAFEIWRHRIRTGFPQES